MKEREFRLDYDNQIREGVRGLTERMERLRETQKEWRRAPPSSEREGRPTGETLMVRGSF